ncbi:MAG: helix-turn-helix transcriptional regulator [Aureliella sp.]
MQTPQFDHIRPIDQSVLEVLRVGVPSRTDSGSDGRGGMTVQQLTEQLDVTPTAVRQRLDRLIQLSLIERRKESVGRGRPQFRYHLTQLGTRCAAASYADLASALWQEVMELPNPQQRSRVLRRVAKRMGEGLKENVPETATVDEKLTATAEALGRRKVAASMNMEGELPVLEVHSCPYPEISETDEGRQLCEMEQEMLSEALGHSVQLDCCQLDGHDHCQFRPVGIGQQEAIGASQEKNAEPETSVEALSKESTAH